MSVLANYIPTIEAFASAIWPQDATVATVWPGVTDVAAGDLTKEVAPGYVETFGVHAVRFYELAQTGALAPSGLYTQEGIGIITPEQGIDFFAELDAQAQTAGPYDTYADWYTDDPVAASALITAGIIPLVTVPITPIGGPEALYTLYAIAWRAIGLAYWSNYPNNRVRNNLIGFGPDDEAEPFYSDAPNKIANPNLRSIGQGGTETTTPAWNYRGYPWPPRQGLIELHESALLDWDQAASEADYATLVAAYADGSAIELS